MTTPSPLPDDAPKAYQDVNALIVALANHDLTGVRTMLNAMDSEEIEALTKAHSASWAAQTMLFRRLGGEINRSTNLTTEG
ncbi:hypothetical protein [Rhodococcus sp. 1168]|uniref:hypothetical protein n=1 Tax=Rhodococcus sp. 1168 TaxID=2018041 RepID=UPI000A0E5701|nr:hypothetical protein [Rhodococcus sp. 1168]ORI15786.1 hypothetical protein BJI47_01445 [Rhodococcus sp. 1168]